MAAVLRLSRIFLGRSGFGRQVRTVTTMVAEVLNNDSSCNDPDFCYIISRYGQVRYPRDRLIPLGEYFSDTPLLVRAPENRLIEEVDEKSPFLTKERINKLIRSGLIPLHLCKLRNISIPSLFEEGNVGVLKGHDVFAFKKLEIQKSISMASSEGNHYKPFLYFFKNMICKYGHPSALKQLPIGLRMLVLYLEQPVVKDNLVLYDPSLFPKHLTATMYYELHRLLREELPARGMIEIASDILAEIDFVIPDFLNNCKNNALLRSYSGLHGSRSRLFRSITRNKEKSARYGQLGDVEENAKDELTVMKESAASSVFWSPVIGTKDIDVPGRRCVDGQVFVVPGDVLTAAILEAAESVCLEDVGKNRHQRIIDGKIKLLKTLNRQRETMITILKLINKKGMLKDWQNSPSAVVDTHRHGVCHAVNKDNCNLIDLFPEVNRQSLIENPYNVGDVVDLFQHKCSEYLPLGTKEMDVKGIWHMLQLEARFPFPDIFNQ